MSENHGRAREMARRGRKYREDREFDIYGEDVTLQYRALVDDEFIPIVGWIIDKFDIDEEIKGEDSVDAVKERLDEVRDEDTGRVDASRLDKEFVHKLQEAAILAITAEYDEDGKRVPMDDEETEEFVKSLMGGLSVEMGYEALELAGDIREAEKFRGGRGSL